jgi:hypothetical protein
LYLVSLRSQRGAQSLAAPLTLGVTWAKVHLGRLNRFAAHRPHPGQNRLGGSTFSVQNSNQQEEAQEHDQISGG